MANTTWSATDKSANVTVSGGNLIATASGASAWVRAADKLLTGKIYWEAKPTVWGNANTAVGFCPGTLAAPNAATFAGMCVVFKTTGAVWVNGAATTSTLGARAVNDVIGIAIDLVARLAWFRVTPAGNWNGSASADPATGVGGVAVGSVVAGGIPAYPLAVMGASADSITANFGDSSFIGTPPSGFTAGFTAGAVVPVITLATQAAIEEWGSAVTFETQTQLTQAAIEQWGTGLSAAQLTQAAIEQWGSVVTFETQVQLTQAGVEVWGSVFTFESQAQLTQIAVEQWAIASPQAQLTQIAVEQWAIPPPAINGPMISILFP